MTRSMRGWVSVLLAAMALTGCSGDDDGGPVCGTAALERALAGAAPGDLVEVGACEIAGTFVVPAGVELRGADAASSRVVGAVQLSPGASDRPTRLARLTLESRAEVGLRADGAGAVTVEDVTVHAALGYGVAFVGLDAVSLSRLSVTGPVTAANAAMLDPAAGSDVTAIYGIVLSHVGSATLTDVSVAGFARVAAAFDGGTTTWTGGSVTDTRGVGLLVSAGVATLDALELRGVFQGGAPIPAYGAVFLDGAAVRSTALVVRDGDGVGLMHSGASGEHDDLSISGQLEAAVWTQRSPMLALTRATLSENGLAGVVAVDADDVSIDDSSVAATEEALHLTSRGAIRLGDGIQLVASTGRALRASIRAARLEGNARVGLLADAGGGALDGVELSGVTVDGTGDQLGVIGQGADAPASWSGAITRLGATALNDESFTGSLAIAEAVDPCALPRPDDLMSGL